MEDSSRHQDATREDQGQHQRALYYTHYIYSCKYILYYWCLEKLQFILELIKKFICVSFAKPLNTEPKNEDRDVKEGMAMFKKAGRRTQGRHPQHPYSSFKQCFIPPKTS